MSQDSHITAELSSPERKKIKLCRRRLAKKRPYSDVSQDSHRDPEMSSPERKWRRITADTEDKVKERPSTTKEASSTVNKVVFHQNRGEEAVREEFDKNFRVNAKVQWFGKAGMRWSGVLPRFYYELSKQSPPDILVVHAGGNDLGLMSPKQLAFLMQKDLQQLHAEFPSMQIAFSSISERRPPQHVAEDSSKVFFRAACLTALQLC
ncbi:unnamed protein product [Scomber scombrus]|uniref:Unnamed protein product n=1 Tax=Scomber scombrus TaxID=13677 RepID=A0AAV1PXS7_SCOSC